MPEDPKPKEPQNAETGEHQPGDAAGLVGVHADAIAALETAIGSVTLLSQVVTHIEAEAREPFCSWMSTFTCPILQTDGETGAMS